MKSLRRKICFWIALVMLAQIFCFPVGAAGERLITIDGTTVYSDWTEDMVAAAFGQPKLVTPSAFGGRAVTYYGDGYSKYLYIETDATGKIVCYSTFTPGYQTDTNSYGDTKPSAIYQMRGYLLADDTAKIWAGCYYNCTKSQFSEFTETWKASPKKYLAAFQKQATLMTQAMAKALDDKDLDLSFNETLFEANEALKEQGSDFYTYAKDMKKTQYLRLISWGSETLIGFSHLPNPLMYAHYGRNYTIPANTSYPCYDFTFPETGYTAKSVISYVDPEVLNVGTYVPMTEEEEALLRQARAIYKQSVDEYNAASAGGSFETPYQYQTCPLTAGVVKPGVLSGSLGYINAIRAGAGLPLLTLSQDLCDAAQAKAVLTMYMSANNIPNPNPHYPPQPEGVSDEFYALSGRGNGENLYMAGMLGSDFIIGSIQYALQEAYGDTIACGHRYNLLRPSWQTIGFGVCRGQGVHKMDGYQSHNVDMVAWPSKGIMLVDANLTPARWTASFYDSSYSTTAETYVTVENLNSGKSWTVTPADDFQRVGTRLISYQDPTITYSVGDICRITIRNLLKDGEPAEYSYRTVFANANADGTSVQGTLKGTVTTFGDDPAAETVVQVLAGDVEMGSDTVLGSTGAYEIQGLRGGIYTVKVTKENHVERQYMVAILKDETVKDAAICLRGDLNGDGRVSVKDWNILKRHLNGTDVLSDYTLRCADVNGDGQVTSSDWLRVKRHVNETQLLW